MKKTIRIIIPLILALAIIFCSCWYLFIYDRAFTRDMLLYSARYFDSLGNHTIAAWFYDCAYKQAGNNDAVAIELADQYKNIGNYTKAEYTLSKAIADGGGVDLYISLCKTYLEQDKLLDAVNMLNNVTNPDVKEQLEMLRPSAPVCSPDPVVSGSYYTQYITVTLSSPKGTVYANSNGEFPSVRKDKYQDGITLQAGENTIYAVTVADNGLVSPAAIYGFTVGGVIEKISFADSFVEAAMREALKVSADKVLYTNDLWELKEFTVPEGAQNYSDLRHLAFLEKLTVQNGVSGQLSNLAGLANLKELYITDTVVTAEEIPVIGNLPVLQKLTLNNCSLSTVAGLEGADELIVLDLGNNTIRNIAPLSGLLKLQQLNMAHNALNDLSALSGLTALTELDVAYNNLTTLSPITAIVNLKKLSANYNTIAEINGFQQFTVLQELELSNNAVADISPLSACTELALLDVGNNKLTDISVLSGLNKLANLNFTNNKVTKLPQWSTDCALVNIDGSYNQISTLEPLKGLKNLNNVFMDYNKNISSVKALATCPVLIQVNVYGTKVTKVSDLTSQSIVVNYDPTK